VSIIFADHKAEVIKMANPKKRGKNRDMWTWKRGMRGREISGQQKYAETSLESFKSRG